MVSDRVLLSVQTRLGEGMGGGAVEGCEGPKAVAGNTEARAAPGMQIRRARLMYLLHIRPAPVSHFIPLCSL